MRVSSPAYKTPLPLYSLSLLSVFHFIPSPIGRGSGVRAYGRGLECEGARERIKVRARLPTCLDVPEKELFLLPSTNDATFGLPTAKAENQGRSRKKFYFRKIQKTNRTKVPLYSLSAGGEGWGEVVAGLPYAKAKGPNPPDCPMPPPAKGRNAKSPDIVGAFWTVGGRDLAALALAVHKGEMDFEAGNLVLLVDPLHKLGEGHLPLLCSRDLFSHRYLDTPKFKMTCDYNMTAALAPTFYAEAIDFMPSRISSIVRGFISDCCSRFTSSTRSVPQLNQMGTPRSLKWTSERRVKSSKESQ